MILIFLIKIIKSFNLNLKIIYLILKLKHELKKFGLFLKNSLRYLKINFYRRYFFSYFIYGF